MNTKLNKAQLGAFDAQISAYYAKCDEWNETAKEHLQEGNIEKFDACIRLSLSYSHKINALENMRDSLNKTFENQ